MMKIETKPRHPSLIFVRGLDADVLQRLTRPIKRVFVSASGWVTLVCKWKSDVPQILAELRQGASG